MILFLLGIRIFSNICQQFIPNTSRSNPQPSRILLLTILTFMRDKSNNVSTKLYDKRDDFSFHIVNFPFLSSNIPSGPTYGVYTSQLIRYARCCSQYSDFSARHKTLVERLLSQGYKSNRLSNTFKKFYDRYNDLIGKYNVSLPNLLKHCCLLDKD